MVCNLLFPVAIIVRLSGKRGHAHDTGFCFQVTGDNVHSLALCDFDGDGKKEVCGGGDTSLCVQLNKFSRAVTLVLGEVSASHGCSWALVPQ